LPLFEDARRRHEAAVEEHALDPIWTEHALGTDPGILLRGIDVERLALEIPHLIEVAVGERALVEAHGGGMLLRPA